MTKAQVKQNDRITLYVGQAERLELLEWVKMYMHAHSVAEAVFSALAQMKRQVMAERRKEAATALGRLRGAWADVPGLDDFYKEMDEGWKRWGQQLS